MAYDVTIDATAKSLTVLDGTTQIANIYLPNIIRMQPIVRKTYNSGAYAVTSGQMVVSPPTTPPVLETQYKARLFMNDKRYLDIPLGGLASQPTWLNSAAGYAVCQDDIMTAAST